jgi:hypothetical protein
MKHQCSVLAAALAVFAGAALVEAQDSRTLTFTNAEVVSINTLQRTMVIRNTQGKQQTVELDDQLAGFPELKPGDQVVLSLRNAPGRSRIRAISKSVATVPVRQPPVATAPAVETTDASDAGALRSYTDRVAAMAQQANQVDRLWSDFRTQCDVTVDNTYESAREWVSLWDADARIDTSSGTCRDLFNQVIAAGETVNAGMAAAEESARQAGLAPGDLREVRRRYSMDWDGWGRVAPERLEQ